MRTVTSAVLGVLAIGLGACYGAAYFPVEGADSDVLRLSGTWAGTYTGLDSGEIRFNLGSGRHTAEGEVVMGDTGAALKINSVEIEDDEVSVDIAPYQDPTCDCEVETKFSGIVIGDTITGTFTSRVAHLNQVHTGNWTVIRQDG